MTSFAEMDEFDNEPVIPGLLYYGLACQLVGESTVGKGRFMRSVAARMTNGQPMPPWMPGDEDGITPPEAFRQPQRVIICAPEDKPEADILPSLKAEGARLELVESMTDVPLTGANGRSSKGKFSMPRDFGLLRETITRLGKQKASDGKRYEVGMVIVDPLLGTAESTINFNQQVRRNILEPMIQMADDTGVAVWLANHVSPRGAKGDDNLIARITGSVGILQALRVTAVITKDPDNPAIRLVRQLSANNAVAPEALRFALDDNDGADSAPHCVYEQPVVSMVTPEARERLQSIVLRAMLESEGPVSSQRLVQLTRMSYSMVQQAMARAVRAGLAAKVNGAWAPPQIAIESPEAQRAYEWQAEHDIRRQLPGNASQSLPGRKRRVSPKMAGGCKHPTRIGTASQCKDCPLIMAGV